MSMDDLSDNESSKAYDSGGIKKRWNKIAARIM